MTLNHSQMVAKHFLTVRNLKEKSGHWLEIENDFLSMKRALK